MGGGKSIGARRSNGERTNSLGEFHLQGLKHGIYIAFAQARNDSEIYSAPEAFEIYGGDVQEIEIKVRRRDTTKGANDHTVLAMGSITGRVAAEDGRGMANMPVMLSPVGDVRPNDRRPTTTDEEGKFEWAASGDLHHCCEQE